MPLFSTCNCFDLRQEEKASLLQFTLYRSSFIKFDNLATQERKSLEFKIDRNEWSQEIWNQFKQPCMANKHALLSPCLNMYYVACASAVGFSIAGMSLKTSDHIIPRLSSRIFGKLTWLKGSKMDLNLIWNGWFDMRFKQLFYARICLLSFHSSRLVFCAYNNRYQTIFNFKVTPHAQLTNCQ